MSAELMTQYCSQCVPHSRLKPFGPPDIAPSTSTSLAFWALDFSLNMSQDLVPYHLFATRTSPYGPPIMPFWLELLGRLTPSYPFCYIAQSDSFSTTRIVCLFCMEWIGDQGMTFSSKGNSSIPFPAADPKNFKAVSQIHSRSFRPELPNIVKFHIIFEVFFCCPCQATLFPPPIFTI